MIAHAAVRERAVGAAYLLPGCTGRSTMGSREHKGGLMHRPRTATLVAGLVLLPVVALLATACGGGGGSKTTTTSASSGSAASGSPASMLPSKYQSKTSVTVATDASYAPMEFVGSNGKTIVGMDPDLAAAIGKVLGLKVKVVNASFDSIIPALQAGKYDFSMSAFTDTKKREQVVDFVTYFSAGTSFYVNAQGGPDIMGLSDLCGKTVAVEKGTTQADDATAQSTKCTGAGKQAVTVSVFPDQNGANLALSSGRAQVGMADSPVAAWIVKQSSGKFKLTGQPYGTAPYGIAIPKGNGLAKPIQAALKQVMADGTYARILKKWGIQQGGIAKPQINAAKS
jgi:polar amino acid transport system substrate-binding protein